MDYLQEAYIANLNVVCHSGGHFVLEPDMNWSNGDHTFSQSKFYYFVGGRCRLSVQDHYYVTEPGMWFFIPAGVRHSYGRYEEESFEKYWIQFDLYPESDLAQVLHLPDHICVGTGGEVERLFRELTRANSSDRLTDRLHAKALLLSLIAAYIPPAQAGIPVVTADSAQLQETLNYIHDHLNEPLTNEQLAAHAHVHPNHFIRRFHEQTGQTPSRYIHQCRMETAKQLLENTTLSVGEIMERVGVRESSYFARVFRKSYSMSPGDYRRHYRRGFSD